VNHLYLIRGLPGSGKSTFAATLAQSLDCPHYEHDQYLYTEEGEYLWTEGRMAFAYRQCLLDTESVMLLGSDVVVSNVFPKGKSMRSYRKLAEQYGYRITYIVVENRRGGVNIHDVPANVLDSMRSAFQIEL
jgi:predicted kinase